MTATDQPLGGGHHYTDEEMHNEDVAHEHGDVNPRTVIVFGIAMLVVIAFSAALMYGLFVAFEKQAEARDPQLSPHAVTNVTPRGPGLPRRELRSVCSDSWFRRHTGAVSALGGQRHAAPPWNSSGARVFGGP